MKQLFILFSIFILFSCHNKQGNHATEKAAPKDTLTPLQVTVIADLPDSLQPKIIDLDTMPKPLTVAVPDKAGGTYSMTNSKGEKITINLEPPVNKRLPVLQNEKGEPLLDAKGKPFIYGDGGKSHFTHFTTDHGLALDGIFSAIEDRKGNLWFGTNGGGVCRYDGKSVMNFTIAQGLANNNVYSILEDKNGNLWFGTGGGWVSSYNGKSFMNFATVQGLANNNVNCILEDKGGNLWFGINGSGLSRYDGKTFMRFTTASGLVNNNIKCMAEDKKRNLWIGTEGGVSCYNGNSFKSFTASSGLANNHVWSIAEDKSGNLWFGTNGGGVSRYEPSETDGQTGKFSSFTTSQGLANNHVYCITEDKKGDLWFGTGGGVSRYDVRPDDPFGRGKSFMSFTTTQGLANNNVYSITEDKSGNLWFGTFGGGVSRYNGNSFTSFTTAEGLQSNNVYTIAEDKSGNLWFGTLGSGVSRYDKKSFMTFTTAQGLANNHVWSILEDTKGNLWFGTWSGMSRYDGKSFMTFTTAQGLANNHVWSILEDKGGNLWFGTNGGGVSRYDARPDDPFGRGRSIMNFTTSQGLASNIVYSIIEDKRGQIWFGTSGGVCRYDGKSFISFTTAQGLTNNSVLSILEDNHGNLWFGTEEGLCVLPSDVLSTDISTLTNGLAGADEKKGSGGTIMTHSKMIKSFKIADGLPDNFITRVNQLPNGKIAVGTNQGITVFNPSEDFTKLTHIEIFNSATGYPVKDVNAGQNCMLLDSKGVIWAGTGSDKTALVKFDYAALYRNTEPPAVVIQSIKVEEENICWYNLQSKGLRQNKEDSATAVLQEFFSYGKSLSARENDAILKRFGDIQFDGISKFYPLPENLELPYDHNQVSFEFAAIETSRPFLVKYQYMLEGYDKDWRPVTNRSNASFGNIREGNYTFKLKAQGANGVWSKPITYTFRVLPPWHRTWWAYSAYALLFLSTMRIFSKWRERKLWAEKERLERTVKERTAVVENQKEELVQKNKAIEREKQRSDELLLNILPEEVAEELKDKGSAEARHFDAVTVMFTDFKGFTRISEKLSPAELVAEIDYCFKTFDHIIEKHNIEKIKTIGDSYMCAGGLPVTNSTHAADVVHAGLEIQQFMQEYVQRRKKEGREVFEIRMGIHTGPVVAGIVGIKKFAYDIWGDTVNTASRMESSGEAGKVNISGSTYELIKDKFHCTHRGKIEAKHKGELDMYFVEGSI